ncbi:MAG: UDP-galactopyranose mutase [Bacteroidales bacterium]|nr:UDP-galactopyranose mutase [Bacteroidales bacterium]
MAKYDYLIVGAGLYGCMFACRARRAGKRCLVVDRRPHLGGNVHCAEAGGIHVHEYGAHIFHTSDKEVWDFVNSIVPFNSFINSPLADFHGERYNLPFNMNTFRQMWGVTDPAQAEAIIEEQRREALQAMAAEGVSEPRNLEEQALLLVGRDIFEKLVKGYTEKQWGRDCKDLPSFIIRRLPVRLTFDNNYFNDTFQGVPVGGYNRLIDGLLEGVETMTGVDFMKERGELSSLADKVLFTGAIDEYYDFKFGPLAYRTLRFEHEILPHKDYQGNAVVNYTDRETPFTRIIEHKHFAVSEKEVLDAPVTVITREFPSEWSPGMEPFYPVNDEANAEVFSRYKALADAEENVVFGGRLAEYRYLDMAPIVRKVLSIQSF